MLLQQPAKSPVKSQLSKKMEGGFSKAFLMRKDNGSEVIAKIPCSIAGPPILTTAGEVGALEYSTSYWNYSKLT